MYAEQATVCVPPPLQFLKEAQDLSSLWEGDEGSSYEGSSVVSADSEHHGCPELVAVRAEGYPIRDGLYKRVPGCEYNGHPVWCNGTWRLYSGKKGYWLMAECSEDMYAQKGYLRSTHPHYGANPTRTTSWQLHTSYGWAPSTVSVTTLFHGLVGDAPAHLTASLSSSSSSSSSSPSISPSPARMGPINRAHLRSAELPSLITPLIEPRATLSIDTQQVTESIKGGNTIMAFLKETKKRKHAKKEEDVIPVSTDNVEARCQVTSCFVM
eukprot:TRINITY_DN2910_c0_g1_i1.p1 TRINITY_DN2910_c0_g1~~TRINITY_DN2910_c0_g1_i1.p1  ORF type:complete len:268 (+),score=73.32 TRINITY_DN2910_c0_g1_i1:55-858(+)